MEEISTRPVLPHAVFAEIKTCISSSARQQTLSLPAVCHAALLHSACSLLPSEAQHSAPCFHNNSCTAGWHSCSVGPHGLLKKAINQSRHSIQAGNWPIRVAQDAYVQAGNFTNWLSIYTNSGTPQDLFTCCSALTCVSFLSTGNRLHVMRPRCLITHPSLNTAFAQNNTFSKLPQFLLATQSRDVIKHEAVSFCVCFCTSGTKIKMVCCPPFSNEVCVHSLWQGLTRRSCPNSLLKCCHRL